MIFMRRFLAVLFSIYQWRELKLEYVYYDALSILLFHKEPVI